MTAARKVSQSPYSTPIGGPVCTPIDSLQRRGAAPGQPEEPGSRPVGAGDGFRYPAQRRILAVVHDEAMLGDEHAAGPPLPRAHQPRTGPQPGFVHPADRWAVTSPTGRTCRHRHGCSRHLRLSALGQPVELADNVAGQAAVDALLQLSACSPAAPIVLRQPGSITSKAPSRWGASNTRGRAQSTP